MPLYSRSQGKIEVSERAIRGTAILSSFISLAPRRNEWVGGGGQLYGPDRGICSGGTKQLKNWSLPREGLLRLRLTPRAFIIFLPALTDRTLHGSLPPPPPSPMRLRLRSLSNLALSSASSASMYYTYIHTHKIFPTRFPRVSSRPLIRGKLHVYSSPPTPPPPLASRPSSSVRLPQFFSPFGTLHRG